jgi:hypothetical protein
MTGGDRGGTSAARAADRVGRSVRISDGPIDRASLGAEGAGIHSGLAEENRARGSQSLHEFGIFDGTNATSTE